MYIETMSIISEEGGGGVGGGGVGVGGVTWIGVGVGGFLVLVVTILLVALIVVLVQKRTTKFAPDLTSEGIVYCNHGLAITIYNDYSKAVLYNR